MRDSGSRDWLVAGFPDRDSRAGFLEHVRRLNGVPDSVPIETELADGTRLRFWSADARHKNLWQLVNSFGGSFTGVFFSWN
jgi:hypothetical protein